MMPMMMSPRTPPGPSPGTIQRAITPTMRPNTIQSRIPIEASLDAAASPHGPAPRGCRIVWTASLCAQVIPRARQRLNGRRKEPPLSPICRYVEPFVRDCYDFRFHDTLGPADGGGRCSDPNHCDRTRQRLTIARHGDSEFLD